MNFLKSRYASLPIWIRFEAISKISEMNFLNSRYQVCIQFLTQSFLKGQLSHLRQLNLSNLTCNSFSNLKKNTSLLRQSYNHGVTTWTVSSMLQNTYIKFRPYSLNLCVLQCFCNLTTYFTSFSDYQ